MNTGPTTPEGKKISAMNSLKHGLTARCALLPSEDRAEFDALIASMRDSYQPNGPLELEVCDEISASLWRLHRARAHEALALETNGDEIFSGDTPAGRGFDRILRYSGAIERQFNRTVVRLQQLQAERRKLEKARPTQMEFVLSTAPEAISTAVSEPTFMAPLPISAGPIVQGFSASASPEVHQH